MKDDLRLAFKGLLIMALCAATLMKAFPYLHAAFDFFLLASTNVWLMMAGAETQMVAIPHGTHESVAVHFDLGFTTILTAGFVAVVGLLSFIVYHHAINLGRWYESHQSK